MARPANAYRVEHGRFDGDFGGGVGDLTVRAAHDPSDSDRALGVGDYQRVGRQLSVDVVERFEPLSGKGATASPKCRPPSYPRSE